MELWIGRQLYTWYIIVFSAVNKACRNHPDFIAWSSRKKLLLLLLLARKWPVGDSSTIYRNDSELWIGDWVALNLPLLICFSKCFNNYSYQAPVIVWRWERTWTKMLGRNHWFSVGHQHPSHNKICGNWGLKIWVRQWAAPRPDAEHWTEWATEPGESKTIQTDWSNQAQTSNNTEFNGFRYGYCRLCLLFIKFPSSTIKKKPNNICITFLKFIIFYLEKNRFS